MKYVWAFNPFDKNKKLDGKAMAIINAIPGCRERLEAVFVASPNYVELTGAFNIPQEDRFSRYPQKLMQTAMKRHRIKASKCTVLEERTMSLTRSVKQLASYLTESKASLAIVASRAKTGLSRFVLGSFAESLVHFSRVDLLIFNESTLVKKRSPQSLLFAHDFSMSADKGLNRAIEYAQAWGCLLHVIHIPDPSYGFKFKTQDAEVDNYRKKVRQKLQRIKDKVSNAGIFGSVEIDPEWNPVADRLLKRATKVGADFVLMVAKSGSLASLLGGSVTRQVLRTSKVPVLVLKHL
jgi:nucleotide-binding universal stress UspA family protein